MRTNAALTEPANSVSYIDGAMTVEKFCEKFGLGRTSTYKAIKEKRLVAKKFGKRTLIPVSSAANFVENLPDKTAA